MVKRTAKASESGFSGYRRPDRFAWVKYWHDEPEFDPETKDAVASALNLETLEEVQGALVHALPEGLTLPFLARIRTNLEFGALESIPFGLNAKWEEIWPAIAPYIVDWNFCAINAETGASERIPAPSEGGLDVFRLLSLDEAAWLLLSVRTGYRMNLESAEGKKGLTTQNDSASP